MEGFRSQFATLVIALLLSACSGSTAYSGRPAPFGSSSVWNNYDARHPVPKGVKVPTRDTRFDQYQDNDAAYTPPKKYMCINSLESDFNCE